MRRAVLLASLPALLLAAGACSDDDPPATTDAAVQADKGTSGDKGTSKDKGPTGDQAPGPDNGPSPDHGVEPDQTVYKDMFVTPDYGKWVFTSMVIDSVTLPTTANLSVKYGVTSGGSVYNAVGDALVALGSVAGKLTGMDLSVVNEICKGNTLNLLQIVEPPSPLSPTPVELRSWVGADRTCCTQAACVSPSTGKCVASASPACFSPTSAHQPHASYTQHTMVKGTYAPSSGTLNLQNGTMNLKLSLTGGKPVVFPLKGVTVRGTFKGSTLTGGIISGGIASTSATSVLLPAMAATLDSIYKAASTGWQTKKVLKTLFDTDGDGTITAGEVGKNALVSKALAGDLDVDNDGKKEVTMGLGFTATKVTIKTTP